MSSMAVFAGLILLARAAETRLRRAGGSAAPDQGDIGGFRRSLGGVLIFLVSMNSVIWILGYSWTYPWIRLFLWRNRSRA